MKMKNLIISTVLVLSFATATAQQQFIGKAMIEFEVKTNFKKAVGTSMGAMFTDAMPDFKTGYYQFTFSGDKSIYKFDRWADGPKPLEFLRKDEEESTYYLDHSTGKIIQKRTILGAEFPIEDSIPKISWRITNENREIAGFNCRKAVGLIMDSVYVFAFYTDEILIPGGPCTINGLPGMILGLTIPRLYTSYIATKVKLNGVNEAEIKPITAKKFSNRTELRTLILDRTKDWGNGEDNEDSKSLIKHIIWNTLL